MPAKTALEEAREWLERWPFGTLSKASTDDLAALIERRERDALVWARDLCVRYGQVSLGLVIEAKITRLKGGNDASD